MHDEHPHPLLAQVPLTVSPFVSLPTGVPLPYSYKTLPSTLPPSMLSSASNSNGSNTAPAGSGAAYVVSAASGQSATPDAILDSCRSLQAHLDRLEADAKEEMRVWWERRTQEDLAEKRRKAPGWLDSGVHMLKPDNVEDHGIQGMQQQPQQQQQGGEDMQGIQQAQGPETSQEGEELDRVFGGLSMK